MHGHLPKGAHNRYTYKGLKIEVYDTNRYSTLTGQFFNGLPLELLERSPEVSAFLEQCQPLNSEENTGVCVCVPTESGDDQAQRPRRTARASSYSAPGDSLRSDSTISAGLGNQAQAIGEADLTRGEQLALKKARAAKNAAIFVQLWEGSDPSHRTKADGSPDISAADFDLILMLLYWTNDDAAQTARLFQASGRYRPEKGAGTSGGQRLSYLDRSIAKAIERRHYKTRTSGSKPEQPKPGPSVEQRQPAHQDRRITHAHHWTRANETPEQRNQLLQETAKRVAQEVDAHIRADRRDIIQVQAIAPGVGKTHATSELGIPGTGLKLAWIAERRDMAAQVPALQTYRLIEPCTHHNCTDHLLHAGLASKSRNTMSVHKRHGFPCGYVRQFDDMASAVYQLAHVKTRHPAKANGIIIDEMDLSKWLPEREIPIRLLTSTLKLYTTNSTADRLIRAVEATITDCSQSKQAPHGRAFFDLLNQRTGGYLRNWIGELAQDAHNTDTHPWTELEETDDMAQLWEIECMAPIVLPHILVALMSELVKWERARDWNSCIRIGRGREGWALFLTEPLKFSADKDNGIPARVVLDATAPDPEILSLVLGEQVEIQRTDIAPPPGTRHLAMRTGKRYGLVSLCATPHANGKPLPNRYLLRAVAEIRYLLREIDPDGQIHAAQKIGLVTFKGCEQEIGDELGIPEHRRLHFWAARGSNALADCEILLLIGTPTQNPASVERLARAIWADDPTPIDPTPKRNEAGHVVGYLDPRLDKLNRYLTRAELTQCAHRSRALREARTVVTMCLDDVDYLPATETITDMPMLNAAGLDAWKQRRKAERVRLDQARQQFAETGKTVHMIRVRELRAAANCSTDTAAEYLRVERNKAQIQSGRYVSCHQPQTQEQSHTHTHLCSHTMNEFVPELVNDNSYTQRGTKLEEAAASSAQLDPEQEVAAYARRAGYPELILPGIHIEA
ncbi:MAG: hypothetical protein ACRDHZ_00005, partial [Ktedonobacteraceae bacterium]